MASLGSRAPTDEEFADLVHTGWPRLYRTALLLTGDHGLAEDLAQSALAATYSRWHRLREPAAAHAYARRALVNAHASWWRRPTNRAERPTEHLPEPWSPRSGDDDPVADRITVLAALARLAPRQRAVVVLRYYDDLSVQETAAALGVSTGTVKSQTSDALARLRDLLGDRLDDRLDHRPGDPGDASRDLPDTPTTLPGGHRA